MPRDLNLSSKPLLISSLPLLFGVQLVAVAAFSCNAQAFTKAED